MEKNKLLKKKQKALTTGNLQNYASACNSLAVYYSNIGIPEEALDEYKNEANAYAKLNKVFENAKAHRMMGEMYMLLGEYDKALENVNLYLKVSIDKKNTLEQQRAYATIGRIYLLHGQSVSDTTESTKLLRSAEQYFNKSLKLCNQLKETVTKLELLDMQGRLYLNLGITRETMGDYDDSIKYLEESIKLCQAFDLYELLYRCYITKGSMFFTKVKDNAKSLKFFRLAIDVAGHLDDKTQKICECLLLMSEVQIKAGDYHSAKKDLIKCYKLKPSDVNDREQAENSLKIIAALCNAEDELYLKSQEDYTGRKTLFEKMGDGCCKLKNYTSAIVYYQKMLECAEKSKTSDAELIPIYVSLSQTYKDLEEYENALTYLWKEYELVRNIPKEAFNTLISIADLYELIKKDEVAIENIYQRAREEAQKMKDIKFENICVFKLNRYYKAAGLDYKSKVLSAECSLSGINVNDEYSDHESESTEEENTPDIGDEICIEDLIANCSDNEDNTNKTVRQRKRPGLVVKKNAKGETQLHQACISGSEILVTRLLEQGHPVMVRDHAGWLPIHEACNNGYTNIVKLLLEKGEKTQINDKGGMQCDGITPLHDACFNGHLEIVDLLLEHGANVNLRTDSGDTPLDSLERWHKDATLNSETEDHYYTIKNQLSSLTKITAATPPKLPSSSSSGGTYNIDPTPSSSSAIRTRSQPKSSYRRNMMDFDSKNESKTNYFDDYLEYYDDDSPQFGDENLFSNSEPSTSKKAAKQAKQEYQQVMLNLRGQKDVSPTKSRLSSLSLQPKCAENSSKRAAYLSTQEFDDDWLDDDMPNKKRQKFLNDSVYDSRSSSISPKKAIPEPSLRSNMSNVDSDLSQDPFEHNDIIENAINNSLTKSGRSRLSLKKSSPYQSSLSQAGFTRERRDSTSSNSQNSSRRNSLQSAQIDSTCPAIESSRIQTQPRIDNLTPHTKSTISIKIKVDGKLFLVPVDIIKLDELTIGWLAEEASERYYKIYNIRPKLQLTTSDGAFLQHTDPLVLVTDSSTSGEIVSSIINNWIKPPLNERYKDVCLQMNFEYDKYLSSLLENCNLTNVIDLKDQQLDYQQIQPVLNALRNETDVFELNLSNNYIYDEGAKLLSEILPSFDRLNKLDLTGNCIMASGLKHICNVLQTKNDALMNLNELNLSFNPLGDTGLAHLIPFINNLKSLTKLYLSNCGIENFIYSAGQIGVMYQLTLFDISFNDKLQINSVRKILNLLNPAIIQTLNFAFSIRYPTFYEDLIGFFNLNCMTIAVTGNRKILHELNLANCKLKDIHFNLIFHKLKSTYESIKILRLSQNYLSVSTLEMLVNSCSEIYIEEIYLNGCNDIIKGFMKSRIIYNENQQFPHLIYLSLPIDQKEYNAGEEIKSLKNMWEKCWGDLGVVSVQGTAVKLFRRNHL